MSESSGLAGGGTRSPGAGSEWSQGRRVANSGGNVTTRSDGQSATSTQRGKSGNGRLSRRDRDLAGFEEMPDKDIKLDSLGHQMNVADLLDLRACKRLCRFRGYGAFVVYDGRAFFKHQSAKQCLEFLVDLQGCTVYLDALGGTGTGAEKITEAPVAMKRRPLGPMRHNDAAEVQIANVNDTDHLAEAGVQTIPGLTEDRGAQCQQCILQ